MADSIQVSFYRIDKSKFEKGTNNKDIINIIVNENSYNTGYKPVKLKDYKDKISLYYNKDTSTPSWNDFFTTSIEDDCISGMSKDLKNIGHSFVAFIKEGDLLLSFCGGQGSNIIKEYIYSDFGVSLFCRMFTKDQINLRAAETRNYVGVELGSHRLFRREQNLIFEDDFGKIYSSIQTEIKSQTILEHFPFNAKELRKNTGCLAKTSFQLKKSIDLKKAIGISESISEILKKEENFDLNKVKKLDSRRDRTLIDSLDEELITFLFDCNKSGDGGEKIELCPKNKILEHLKCDSFKFFKKKGKKPICEFEDAVIGNLDDIFYEYRSAGVLSTEGLEDFKIDISGARYEFCADENLISKGSFLSLVNAEIEFESVNYLKFDGNWYRIEGDFVIDLNEKLDNQLRYVLDASLLRKKWTDKPDGSLTKEEDYIKKYFNSAGIYPLHTIKTNLIEPCDLMIIRDQVVYLVHVKKGFDASVRELCQQAMISFEAIMNAVKAGDDFLKIYYDKIKKKSQSPIGGTDYNQKLIECCKELVAAYNKREFVKLFTDSEASIIPCVAFVDDASVEKKIRDGADQFSSNIAKFSIRNLVLEMGKLQEGASSARVKVIQIPR